MFNMALSVGPASSQTSYELHERHEQLQLWVLIQILIWCEVIILLLESLQGRHKSQGNIWWHFKFIYIKQFPFSVLFAAVDVANHSSTHLPNGLVNVGPLLINALGVNRSNQAGRESYTRRTALIHPSFSGLFVTWAYLPEKEKKSNISTWRSSLGMTYQTYQKMRNFYFC